VGAYIISLLRNGCVLYDIPNPVQEIVTGVIIVAAVTIDQLLLRRRS
jgi:ABC-type xylose transport system permease subunit